MREVLRTARIKYESVSVHSGREKVLIFIDKVFLGKNIGATSFQSIGETAAHLTLYSFHYAGVYAKSVTLGAPRLKDLVVFCIKVKTPSLTVRLHDAIKYDIEETKKIQAQLKRPTIGDMMQITETRYDRDPNTTVVE